MTRPATLYARASAPTPTFAPPRRPAWGFNPAMAHGRWTRVLRACALEPLPIGDINRLVRKYGAGRTNRSEKARTWRAVSTLYRLRLLAHADGRYLASGAGLRALADVRHGLTAAAEAGEAA